MYLRPALSWPQEHPAHGAPHRTIARSISGFLEGLRVEHLPPYARRARRAWRKANAYLRLGRHAKAELWFRRTQQILIQGDQPSRLGCGTAFLLIALFILGALVALVLVALVIQIVPQK
jgi:hypothetical protein